MLSKTQLFHLDKLTPTNVLEMNVLLSLLEYAIKYCAVKVGLTNLTDIKEIYCNRVNIHHQSQTISYAPPTSEAEAEFRTIHCAVEKLMETIVDSYHINRKITRYTQLNIECSVLNRNSVAVSFDFY